MCRLVSAAAPAAKGKGSKGGKSAAEAEEIDALLAELDAPKQPAAEPAGGGKKKKKKKEVRMGLVHVAAAHLLYQPFQHDCGPATDEHWLRIGPHEAHMFGYL